MTMVRLNAFGIATDGDDVASVAHDISTAWSSLHSALSGTAGMAGDDESAEQFAGVYDDQARSAATSAKNLVGMLAAFETLLAGTGSAYKDAELASAGQQGGSGIAVPASDYAVATDLPSSLGAGWPGGWGKVEDVLQDALRAIGVQLPQGDPDKLSSAASSWESYEASLRAASSKLSGGLTQVDAADIPQKATILAAKSTMSGHISTAADAATGAAGSLKQIKANYDQAAEEIRSMIEQLLAELALDVGISIALSFVTFGLGALAGAANGARIVVTWATRIAGVIRKLAFLNKIHAEQFLKAANMLRKLEHGSFVTRFTYETVKGTITGTAAPIIVNAVHGKGTSMDDIISNAVGSVVGGAFGFGSGAAMSRVGRNAAADAAGGAAPTFWRATAVEGAKGAASGAAGGAAGNVATDATAAALDPEHHHFNVLQSLANGTVFGTAGGGVTGAGGHALSSGWNAVTSSGRTHVPGAGGDGATTSTSSSSSSSSSVDSSVTLPDGGVSAESTGVGGDASGHAPTIDHGNTSTSAHAPTIDHGNSGASANAPTVADTGAPAPASPEGHVDVSNVQTPVVNDAAQAAPAQHAGGDRPHSDASQTPVVNDADPADHGSSTPVDTTSVPDPATSPASPDATVDAGSSHESATSTGHAPAADATQPAGAPAPDPATPQHGAADETPPSADIAATATHVQADRPTPTDSGTGQGAHAAAAADSAHVGAADAGTGHTVSDPARADANPVETVQTGTDNTVPTGTAHVPADASTAAAGAGAAAVAHTPVAPTTPGSQFRTDWEATNGRPWEPQYPPGSARPSQTVPLSPSTDQVLAQHGMTRADYDHLVSRPLDELSASELHTAVSIRDAAPGFQPGEAFQKVVNPGDVMGTFPAEFRHLAGDDLGDVFDGVQPNDPNFNRYGPVQVMGGFVARFDDVAHLGHDDLYGNLGLGYDGTMFSRSGSEPVFAVRAQLDQAGVSGLHVENDIATDLSNRFGVGSADGGAAWDAATPAERRDWMIDRGVQIKDGDRYLAAADPSNPYRGNGWAGEGTLAVPESTLRLWQLPDGAEMWRYNADGTQDVVAVMDNGHWVVLDTK